MYNSVRKTLLLLIDDIPVTTDGRELCLLVRLVQQAGKWFSSSLALGTDIVADILTVSSLTCLALMIMQDDNALPAFNPHGAPITHSST